MHGSAYQTPSPLQIFCRGNGLRQTIKAGVTEWDKTGAICIQARKNIRFAELIQGHTRRLFDNLSQKHKTNIAV